MSAAAPVSALIAKVLDLATSPAGQLVLQRLLDDHGVTLDKLDASLAKLERPSKAPPPEETAQKE